MKQFILLILCLMFGAAVAAADGGIIAFTADAKITGVEPVTETVAVRRKEIVEECERISPRHVRRAAKRNRHDRRHNRSGTEFIRPSDIIGGATGAILGSHFGKGNGKTAAAAAGAILGSRVGRYLEEDRGGNAADAYAEPRNVRICEDREVWRRVSESVQRYRVTFEWQGQTGAVVLDSPPRGESMRLSVRARPAQ